MKQEHYDIAAYVWPAYQPEPRWKELGIFEHGVGEWQNVYEARVKRPGDHVQPRVPLWGYENEADPLVMARKIDAATSAGVNVFIYDWYWYKGRPFLENALNEGFLKAPNQERMQFYIMWANHDVGYAWNNKLVEKTANPPLFDGHVTLEEFREIAQRWVTQYFSRPNYYCIDGKPVVSLYKLDAYVEGVGGLEQAKVGFDYLRDLAKAAGYAGVHIQYTGIVDEKSRPMIQALGVESATLYNWNWGTNIFVEPNITYRDWMAQAIPNWDRHFETAQREGLRYFPNVTIGWDRNPRWPAEAWEHVVKNSNPADFEDALRQVRSWMDAHAEQQGGPKLITIYSWNEWTEGGYLEPDELNGYGYLNAIHRVFRGS